MQKNSEKTVESGERDEASPKSLATRALVTLALVAVSLVVAAATFVGLANQPSEPPVEGAVQDTEIGKDKEIEEDSDLPETASGNAVAELPETDTCNEPTGLTEFQGYVSFDDCEFVVWEVTETGDVILVSGNEQLFQSIFDDSEIVSNETYAVPDQSTAPSSGRQSSGPTSRPAPEESYTAAPKESYTPAPPPLQEPVATQCPWQRGENPAVYDACREGFVPPTRVAFTGILRCEKYYETDPVVFGEVWPGRQVVYSMTIGLELFGGNFRSSSWGGVSEQTGPRNALITKPRVYGLGEGPFDDYPVPIGDYSEVISFQSMDDRYPGEIYRERFHYGNDPILPTIFSDLRACN